VEKADPGAQPGVILFWFM